MIECIWMLYIGVPLFVIAMLVVLYIASKKDTGNGFDIFIKYPRLPKAPKLPRV